MSFGITATAFSGFLVWQFLTKQRTASGIEALGMSCSQGVFIFLIGNQLSVSTPFSDKLGGLLPRFARLQ